MESENINNEKQNSIVENTEIVETNDVEKSSSEIATSTSKIKETTEDNKENDENSSKEIQSQQLTIADIQPKLRLVPLEKLLAPQYSLKQKQQSQSSLNSSIIVLNDSDDDDDYDNNIPKLLINKPILNKEKLQSKNCTSSDSIDTDNLNNKKLKRDAIKIPNEVNSRPIRCNLRQAKFKTIEKIKNALATSSSEYDDDDENNEIKKSNKKTNKYTKKVAHNSHITITSDSSEDDHVPILKKYGISKKKLECIKNSTDNDTSISTTKKITDIVTTPKPENTISNNNKDCNIEQNLSLIQQNSILDEVVTNGNKNNAPPIVVRLTRSTKSDDNDSQNKNYEIISNNEQLQTNLPATDENQTDKIDNENAGKIRNNTLKLSTKTIDKLLENFEKHSSSSSNECENTNIDKIETAKKQNCSNNNNNNKSKISNNLIENKLKKFQIRLKRLSLNTMKKIIKESITTTSEISKDSPDIRKCVRRRRKLRGLSSSESAMEEEQVIEKNMGIQRRNTRRDSNSNDDANNKDDTNNIKAQKKSTTTMSSSEDDDIQQNEDRSSDDSNSSELFRKRTVTSRMKKSTKRSDEEYVVNSADDDDNTDNKKNNSDNDDDDYESDNKKKNKRKQTAKRKRIKNASDSSDDDDDEAGGSNKKRKNIRKLIKTKELNMDTKQAAQAEKDRRKRIEERQTLYNSIYKKPETTELTELILDFDEETKKPLLKVDPGLLKLLKPHQATGVKFMWDACYETLTEAEESSGSGCILAHCMGLGKTLQVIALTHTLITNSRKTNVERVLIITPLSTLTNWAREYHHWMKSCKNKDIEIYDMSKFKDKTLRTYKLNEWFEEGGVCLMGYDMYRILSNEKTKGLRKKQRETLQQCLVDPGADIVICDEGHLLKNEKTSISKAVTKMRTQRRIVLTGTPLQNNLKEYYCMIQFIKPNLLGTYKEYLNRFVNPITNGQYTDSTERDIRLMKHRSHILHTLLEGCLQRRDYSVLAPYLPPKHEYVIYITLSDVQKTLYEYYMTKHRNHIEDMTGKGAKLFQDFQNLRRIWTHPMSLRVNSDIAIKKRLLQSDSEGSLKDFIDDHSVSASSDSDSSSFNSDKSVESIKAPKRIKTRNQRLNNATDDSDIEEVPIIVNKEDPSEWWCQMVPKEELNNINHSPKLILLMKILDECEQIGDKLLLFSQSLQSLGVIEEFLSFINRKTQGVDDIDCNINDYRGIWQPGVDYFRLDGSSSVEQRDQMCKTFNNVNNLRARLFLISTRAGSLGINLVAANRVIIFDVSWNPSHDTQSIFRVYRFGQDKPCYIYRFIAMGTMEQKIYERQVAKQAMAKRVIDEHQIGRHYNQNDLLELYTYELESKIPREIPILPKDRLFADLLANYEKLIYKYHEHDSLLENQESDNLSEEERKAAWDEYETEKNRPPQQQYVMYNRPTYTIGPGGYQAHHGPVTSNKIFGFRTDILLRLLNMKVGRDNPRLTPNEIVQMVPSYLQQLYSEMNQNNPTMYKELLELHQQLEMPQGYYMNPLLYTNQNEMMEQANGGNRVVNPYANRPPPTISSEIVEID